MAWRAIEDAELTPIADEIREKTGLSDALELGQMVIDIASLPGRLVDVPTYVETEAKRVADIVSALQNDNTLSFICMSDAHVATTSAQRIASALHAAQGAKIIGDIVPIDFIAVLGDVVSGSSGDSAQQQALNHAESLRLSSVADPAFRLCGNHDADIYSVNAYQTAADLYRYTGRFTRATKPASETERNYFYCDIEDKKTRVICLNTADLKDLPAIGSNGNAGNKDGHYISAAQLAWLVSVLDMTGKTGWRVIVLSHHPIHWSGSMTSALAIIEAYVKGTSGSVTVDGTTVSFNFSGKNVAKLVATVHGHTHNLISGKVGSEEIVRIGTPNVCYDRNNEYGSSAYGDDFRAKYGETTTYAKTVNSAKDTAFVVYTIDFDKEVISATCYGAGYDRSVSYAGKVYYSVANTLTNVTTSNSAALVEGGAAYTATLMLKSGYEFTTVTVKMGGVDITSSAYSNGVITIAKVTGDIVITAAAAKQPVSYNVDIAAVGYTDNARWSTSSGDIKTGVTGFTAINLIEFSRAAGETVTVELSGIDWYYNTNCAIVFYRGATKVTAQQFTGSAYVSSGNGISIAYLGSGKVTVTLVDPTDSSYDGINGFKVCGCGAGKNAVIKITNQ